MLSMKPRYNGSLPPAIFAATLFLTLGSSLMADQSKALQRIHFGSCIKQNNPSPIFQTILADQPELFLMIGDNIYADTEDMEEMKAKYAKLNTDPGFSMLRASCPVLATWDDHDYGRNDAGSDYAKRKESQEIFLNFWGDPPSSSRRHREGVYDAYVMGPKGKRVQLILLDTRYFRGPLTKGERRVAGPYYPNTDPAIPMLGEAQWKWLKEELLKPADLRVIVSSIQFIAEAAGQETWSNLPAERQRMLNLIMETKAEGVLFISGDRHWADLSVQKDLVPYPIYDVTSSSLNQPHPRGSPSDNKYRALKKTFHHANFGVLKLDWEAKDPKIHLEIRDIENQLQLSHSIRLSELSFKD